MASPNTTETVHKTLQESDGFSGEGLAEISEDDLESAQQVASQSMTGTEPKKETSTLSEEKVAPGEEKVAPGKEKIAPGKEKVAPGKEKEVDLFNRLTPEEMSALFYKLIEVNIANGSLEKFFGQLFAGELDLSKTDGIIKIKDKSQFEAFRALVEEAAIGIFRKAIIDRYDAKVKEGKDPQFFEISEYLELKSQAYEEALKFIEDNYDECLEFITVAQKYIKDEQGDNISANQFFKDHALEVLSPEDYMKKSHEIFQDKYEELFKKRAGKPEFNLLKLKSEYVLTEDEEKSVRNSTVRFLNRAIPNFYFFSPSFF